MSVDIIDKLFFFSGGGVELLTHGGQIKLTNTLESRLELLYSQVRFTLFKLIAISFLFQMLPEFRTTLFGPNPSRHFMD